MTHTGRRAAFYGLAALVLVGLCYVGFVRRADADASTLLGAADVQLRLAAGMPANGRDGQPLAARQALLVAAAASIGAARRQAPDSAVAAEFEGFHHSLCGEHRQAAACYRAARAMADCSAEQRSTLVFNEARMLAAAGDGKAALAVFTEHQATLPAELQTQRCLEEAQILHDLRRLPEATARLQQVMAATDAPVAWMQAGRIYAAMGQDAAAEAAYVRAATSVPQAYYHHARLKLAAGDVDSCLGLLERAAKAVPAEVRRLLREDAAAWQVLAADVRFQQATAQSSATPGR